MGLNHPRDLDAWHAWQRSRSPLRQLVDRVRPQPPLTGTLTVHGREPRVLVVLDWLAPTSLMAVFEMTSAPVRGVRRALTRRRSRTAGRAHRSHPSQDVVPEELSSVTVVVGAGHYLPLGAVAHAWSRRLGARFVAVQHGLLTPHAPPLAPDSTLLAWSAADADFWRSGRPDVQTQVVGSQLLWEASRGRTRVTDDRPTFLGQLHSAEMGRREMATVHRRVLPHRGHPLPAAPG